MTDEEAYELLVKYSDETTMLMVKQMIHEIGIEGTIVNIVRAYAEGGKHVNDEVKDWMHQAYEYMLNHHDQKN